MAVEDRQNDFRRAVQHDAAIRLHMKSSFGFSNGARFIEGAFFVGSFNIEHGVPAVDAAACLFSMVSLTERIEVHLAALRKKIDVGRAESLIQTVHRQGYQLRPPEAQE